MNALLKTIVILVATATAIQTTLANETDLIEPLRSYTRGLPGEFGQIAPDRIATLNNAASFVRERLANGKSAQLTFICTHNSRRSHLAQIWAQTAATYYNLSNVTAFSGGTEATACNIRTVRALRRAGFSIVDSTSSTNPVYLAKVTETAPPLKLFSKVYSADGNPQRDFAAMFCCDQADSSCPTVTGAALRVPIHYKDPKVSDNSPEENSTYDERCRQIAREMFYLMSAVRRAS